MEELARRPVPMRLVPSKKGLATVFTFAAFLGYLTGIGVRALVLWLRHGV